MGHPFRRRSSRLSPLECGLIAATVIAVALIVSPLLAKVTSEARAASSEVAAISESAIVGHADVRDGDGLRIEGQTIRLHGVDAFELYQTCGNGACGQAARHALARMIAGQRVACEPVTTDRYDRVVAVCQANGVDLGAELVRAGHALAFRRYSRDYIDEEAEARRNQTGAWTSDFQDPADWCREHPRS